jgi:hypothetical protein
MVVAPTVMAAAQSLAMAASAAATARISGVVRAQVAQALEVRHAFV